MRVEGVFLAICLVSHAKAFKKCAEDQDCPIGTVCNVSRNLCIIVKKNKQVSHNDTTRRYTTESPALKFTETTPILIKEIPVTEVTSTALSNSDAVIFSPPPEDAENRLIEVDVDTHNVHIPLLMLSLQNFYEKIIFSLGIIIILPIAIVLGIAFLILIIPLGLVWHIFNVVFTAYETSGIGRNTGINKPIVEGLLKMVQNAIEIYKEINEV
ncbi:uncharacterized protein LOC136037635 [Artemia franciscana]